MPWLFAMLLVWLPALLYGQDGADGLLPSTVSVPGNVDVLSLDDLVREALEKNPEAQSALYTVQALERRVPQAKALPDPMVSVGWAGNLAPFSLQRSDPSSNRQVTVAEEFPYPGKLKLRGQIAGKDAEAAQADYEGIRRRIAAEVKSAFYDYYYFDQAIRTTNENKDLLEKLAKIAEVRYRVGKAMQQDVLRSQVEISLLLEKLTELNQQRDTAQARLNTFLLRSPDSPLPPPAEVQPATIHYSLDELYALAASNDIAVLRNQKTVEQGHLGVELAKREYRPDIGVSYMYQQRSAQTDMNGLTFSVSVPIFYKAKQAQAVAGASKTLLSAEKMQDNRLNEVRFELKQLYLEAKASERLLTLYSKGVVPQSSLALESSMAAYQVGNVDFLSLIANFTTLLSYETDYYRQLADYQTSIARIESLTGEDITDAHEPESHAPTSLPLNEEK
jgi:outer membrane protein TolC